MIPIQDVIPSRAKPWVTLVLIGTIGLALMWELMTTPAQIRTWNHAYEVATLSGRWMFAPVIVLLHTGLLHAGGNMLALWIFGDTLEDRLGHVRFAALYVAAAVISSAALVMVRSDTGIPQVGSSGAVAAVIAAYLTQWPRSQVLVLVPLPFVLDLVEIPAAIVPGFWLLLQVIAVSRGGSVAEATHVLLAMGAGAATGVALGPLLARGRTDWWTQG
jgi:membrane associated rhomboid family serine protease